MVRWWYIVKSEATKNGDKNNDNAVEFLRPIKEHPTNEYVLCTIQQNHNAQAHILCFCVELNCKMKLSMIIANGSHFYLNIHTTWACIRVKYKFYQKCHILPFYLYI